MNHCICNSEEPEHSGQKKKKKNPLLQPKNKWSLLAVGILNAFNRSQYVKRSTASMCEVK